MARVDFSICEEETVVLHPQFRTRTFQGLPPSRGIRLKIGLFDHEVSSAQIKEVVFGDSRVRCGQHEG